MTRYRIWSVQAQEYVHDFGKTGGSISVNAHQRPFESGRLEDAIRLINRRAALHQKGWNTFQIVRMVDPPCHEVI